MKLEKEIVIIFGISLIGEGLSAALPLPVPAGVYGLFMMLFLLWSGMLKLEQVEGSGNFLLKNMSPMFIPPGVGLILYREELLAVGLPYLLINVISTVFVFFITGSVAQWIMTRQEGKKNEADT